LVDVWFSGYGSWWLEDSNGNNERVTTEEEEKGYFKLTEDDGLSWEHAKSTFMVDILKPCDRPNCAFLKMVEKGKLSKDDVDRCYFEICKSEIIYSPVIRTAFQSEAERAKLYIESLKKPEVRKVNYDLTVVEPYKLNSIETKRIERNTNITNEADNIDDWKAVARKIGERIHKEDKKLSVDKIAAKVCLEMVSRKSEKGMTGRGGKVPSADTIKRHALTGVKS
jgi:hypothetical protein